VEKEAIFGADTLEWWSQWWSEGPLIAAKSRKSFDFAGARP
jgi:hypothetical protein